MLVSVGVVNPVLLNVVETPFLEESVMENVNVTVDLFLVFVLAGVSILLVKALQLVTVGVINPALPNVVVPATVLGVNSVVTVVNSLALVDVGS